MKWLEFLAKVETLNQENVNNFYAYQKRKSVPEHPPGTAANTPPLPAAGPTLEQQIEYLKKALNIAESIELPNEAASKAADRERAIAAAKNAIILAAGTSAAEEINVRAVARHINPAIADNADKQTVATDILNKVTPPVNSNTADTVAAYMQTEMSSQLGIAVRNSKGNVQQNDMIARKDQIMATLQHSPADLNKYEFIIGAAPDDVKHMKPGAIYLSQNTADNPQVTQYSYRSATGKEGPVDFQVANVAASANFDVNKLNQHYPALLANVLKRTNKPLDACPTVSMNSSIQDRFGAMNKAYRDWKDLEQKTYAASRVEVKRKSGDWLPGITIEQTEAEKLAQRDYESARDAYVRNVPVEKVFGGRQTDEATIGTKQYLIMQHASMNYTRYMKQLDFLVAKESTDLTTKDSEFETANPKRQEVILREMNAISETAKIERQDIQYQLEAARGLYTDAEKANSFDDLDKGLQEYAKKSSRDAAHPAGQPLVKGQASSRAANTFMDNSYERHIVMKDGIPQDLKSEVAMLKTKETSGALGGQLSNQDTKLATHLKPNEAIVSIMRGENNAEISRIEQKVYSGHVRVTVQDNPRSPPTTAQQYQNIYEAALQCVQHCMETGKTPIEILESDPNKAKTYHEAFKVLLPIAFPDPSTRPELITNKKEARFGVTWFGGIKWLGAADEVQKFKTKMTEYKVEHSARQEKINSAPEENISIDELALRIRAADTAEFTESNKSGSTSKSIQAAREKAINDVKNLADAAENNLVKRNGVDVTPAQNVIKNARVIAAKGSGSEVTEKEREKALRSREGQIGMQRPSPGH